MEEKSPVMNLSSPTRAPADSSMGGDGGRQRVGRFVIERAIQVAEHAQSVLTRRFRNQPSDVPLISHEHDLLLVALYGVENGAEVAGDRRPASSSAVTRVGSTFDCELGLHPRIVVRRMHPFARTVNFSSKNAGRHKGERV